MISALLFFSLALASINEHLAQESSTGIYIVIKGKKNDECQNRIFSASKKISVCATPKPILSEVVFESTTEIRNDEIADVSYFNLILSRAGADKLKGIMSRLPDTEMALVVDNTLVGMIGDFRQSQTRLIQVNGKAHSTDVIWAYENLKRVILDNK